MPQPERVCNVYNRLKFGTETAAGRVLDLVIHGRLTDDHASYRWANRLASLLHSFPALRRKAYGLMAGAKETVPSILIRAAIEIPDLEGVLLLIDLHSRGLADSPGWQTLQDVVTKRIPVDGASNIFTILPIEANELRKQLLARVTDGTRSDTAATSLTVIDTIRDEYGLPPGERRHPDLASGKQWPMIA